MKKVIKENNKKKRLMKIREQSNKEINRKKRFLTPKVLAKKKQKESKKRAIIKTKKDRKPRSKTNRNTTGQITEGNGVADFLNPSQIVLKYKKNEIGGILKKNKVGGIDLNSVLLNLVKGDERNERMSFDIINLIVDLWSESIKENDIYTNIPLQFDSVIDEILNKEENRYKMILSSIDKEIWNNDTAAQMLNFIFLSSKQPAEARVMAQNQT